jgi:hypothetical protein
VNGNGKLGVTTSSNRFKEAIKPMDKASEAILALKPVTFRYNSEIDAKGTPQFGLVAQDVAKVNPDLVMRDEEGNPYTVRYDAVNAMLLNEFLKEHRKNEEQKAIIARQQKQIEALTASLQKVSAQVELSKAASQTSSTINKAAKPVLVVDAHRDNGSVSLCTPKKSWQRFLNWNWRFAQALIVLTSRRFFCTS